MASVIFLVVTNTWDTIPAHHIFTSTLYHHIYPLIPNIPLAHHHYYHNISWNLQHYTITRILFLHFFLYTNHCTHSSLHINDNTLRKLTQYCRPSIHHHIYKYKQIDTIPFYRYATAKDTQAHIPQYTITAKHTLLLLLHILTPTIIHMHLQTPCQHHHSSITALGTT